MSTISIICPVYNGHKYLDTCIKSIINQTYKNLEIIFINDCSTDNSLEILEQYAKTDSRIKIITLEQNSGQSIAKNKGIELANGQYIMFIDQDDWLNTDACEKCYNKISQYNDDLLLFDFNKYYEDKDIFKKNKVMLKPYAKLKITQHIKLYELNKNFFINGWAWCYIYNTEFLRANNIKFPTENRLVDDIPFAFKALAFAETISVINEPLYNYRINNFSVTQTRPDLWKEYFIARELAFQAIQESKYNEIYIPYYLEYYINTVMYWYRKCKKYAGVNYYSEMKNLFTNLEIRYKIVDIKNRINYTEYKDVIRYDYKTFECISILKRILSISQEGNYLLLRFLGIKLNIKIRGK